MPTVADVVDLVHGWYPPATADSWDAVGLAVGNPLAVVRRVLLAVDVSAEVVLEATERGADLLLTHHPLLLRGATSVAETSPKGRSVADLVRADCALLTAHTNADPAVGGVSESLARALGLRDLEPLEPADTGESGVGAGRIGSVGETTLGDFARTVAAALPPTPVGVLVGGAADHVVRRVAVAGGAGDFLLDAVRRTDADVYVTSDLRHHPAIEFLDQDGPALVQVSHWAAEWTWLPVVQARLAEALGATVESHVSTTCTDAWRHRVPQEPNPTPRSSR